MQSRIVGFDVIRVFASLGVVAIHAEIITSSPTNYLGGLSWWFANLAHSAVIVSVPLFVMLSGALVLSKTKVTYTYVWQKILRQLFLPLAAWWLFYYWWTTIRVGLPATSLDMLRKFWITDTGHLYFLPISIGLYVVAPLIKKWLVLHSVKKQWAMFLIVLCASIFYEYGSQLMWHSYNSTTAIIIFLPFISYFLLGYLLRNISLSARQWQLAALAAGGLATATAIATYLNTVAFNLDDLSFWTPQGGNFFWEPFTLLVYAQTVATFLVLNTVTTIFPHFFAQRLVQRILTVLSLSSFGVYLVHPALINIIDAVFKMQIQYVSYPLWIYFLLRCCCVYVFSVAVVHVMRNTPLVKMLIGEKN